MKQQTQFPRTFTQSNFGGGYIQYPPQFCYPPSYPPSYTYFCPQPYTCCPYIEPFSLPNSKNSFVKVEPLLNLQEHDTAAVLMSKISEMIRLELSQLQRISQIQYKPPKSKDCPRPREYSRSRDRKKVECNINRGTRKKQFLDWVCSKCQFSNFMKRKECKRCLFKKDPSTDGGQVPFKIRVPQKNTI